MDFIGILHLSDKLDFINEYIVTLILIRNSLLHNFIQFKRVTVFRIINLVQSESYNTPMFIADFFATSAFFSATHDPYHFERLPPDIQFRLCRFR